MGANEAIVPSKSEKSSSVILEQSSIRSYLDWGSMQAYYGPGVPFPTAYFGTTVAPPGHSPYPYMWTPQLLTPFGGAYPAIYPHGGLYSHLSATHIMPDPVNPEAPAKTSNTTTKMIKGNDVLALVTTGNHDASAGCTDNRSESEENDAEDGSSDGSDGNSNSGGSEKRRNRSSEDMSYSGSKNLDSATNKVNGAAATNMLPNTSLVMAANPLTVNAIPLINLTPGMDLLRTSSIGKQKLPLGEPISATIDERAFKREKRKQSNRESARRSRLRKQAETEELAIRVGSLNAENTTLRSEITRLIECSDKLRIENSIITEKLKMAHVRQENEEICADGRTHREESPSLVIENLLSRMDKSIPAIPASNEGEDDEEPLQSSKGKLHQLLDTNHRTTDTVAANS